MRITIEQISEITGIRVPVLKFAFEMERKLRINSGKGGWQDCDNDYLLSRINDELFELKACINEKKVKRAIINECADVANFAMMIADNQKNSESLAYEQDVRN